MSFEPVFLEESLGNRASMTFLRHANRCMRSGFLYAKHRRRGVQTVEMVRGSAAHLIHERGTRAMLDMGELELPPDVCKAIVSEVLAEMPVPVEEHDYLREYAHRWASQWRLRPDERVVGVERLFVLELAGWQVRCKVDFATADDMNRLYVADYKSGRGAPPYEEIARKRPGVEDGALPQARMSAKAFQLIVYVLAVVFGRPVERKTVPCEKCDGRRTSATLDDSVCGTCGGAGSFVVNDGLGEQVVRGCQEAIAEYVFPGIESSDGLMLRRTVGLTRLEMLEYLESLEALLTRVGDAEKSGDWPAVVSDAACGECPCMSECPIPSELRDLRGRINSVEELQETLQRRHVARELDRALGREIRAFFKNQLGDAPVRYGARVAEVVPRESVEVRDKPGLYEALAGGMPVEEARAKFERPSKGTSFVERDLSEGELEERTKIDVQAA
ncbi:MAG TPA: PD-(D/E)XK nuclease family protein [Solirubrobacteraceae bacterium]|jgi:hypothetical protein